MTDATAASRWFQPKQAVIAYEDLVLLVTSDYKRYLLTMRPRQQLHTHQGIYLHDDLVGRQLGDVVQSQLGHEAILLEPALGDLITHLKRGTQIIYPKDAAYLVHRLNLRSGSRVIEAGTGSAGLTTALAWAVAPAGRVFTYEARSDNVRLARKNLERVALLPYVEIFEQSIDNGVLQTDADAMVLDVREPWQVLDAVEGALRPGGFFAGLVPTANQVSTLLSALEKRAFADLAVEELLLRRYKAVPERLRPEDEMVAHTGYLIFARQVARPLDPQRWMSKERRRYLARRRGLAQMEARRAREAATDGPRYPKLPLPG